MNQAAISTYFQWGSDDWARRVEFTFAPFNWRWAVHDFTMHANRYWISAGPFKFFFMRFNPADVG